MPALLYRTLRSRDLQSDIKSLPETLSSWNKCMEKNYCKYPVIAGCIIGGLIALSLLWCLIRCCMCGYACCSCCCGGCGGSRRKKSRVEIITPPPPVYQPPPYHETPQYAYVTDRNGNVSGDSLPAMPTWEAAKVEMKEEEVELEYVNNDGHRRNLTTPAPTPFDQVPPQRGVTPGPMPAPIPVHASAQKLGFNPRGPSPSPHQYDDRDPIQDNYGYDQQGPRWGQPAPPQRNAYDLPYQNQPQQGPPRGPPRGYSPQPDHMQYPQQDYPQQHYPHQDYPQMPRQDSNQRQPPQDRNLMYPLHGDGLDRGYMPYDDRQKRQQEWSAL
ncbi:hypothetical protein BDZ91DRAFT_524458 [Kalaharituber pfeilii]|nr:hypothetical protein BDZ91DRAFT_524458 [Kalaharituber pfeilii]